jgi:hypothetical protein
VCSFRHIRVHNYSNGHNLILFPQALGVLEASLTNLLKAPGYQKTPLDFSERGF